MSALCQFSGLFLGSPKAFCGRVNLCCTHQVPGVLSIRRLLCRVRQEDSGCLPSSAVSHVAAWMRLPNSARKPSLNQAECCTGSSYVRQEPTLR